MTPSISTVISRYIIVLCGAGKYRRFVGCHAEVVPGIMPDAFAREMIQAYVNRECKGKLKKIERSYVEREMERRNRSSQTEHAP